MKPVGHKDELIDAVERKTNCPSQVGDTRLGDKGGHMDLTEKWSLTETLSLRVLALLFWT